MAVLVPAVVGSGEGMTAVASAGSAITLTLESPGASTSGDRTNTHLLGDGADLLSWQVVEGENEPPVKAAFASQGPIMHICLLLVLLKANHPPGHSHFREHS